MLVSFPGWESTEGLVALPRALASCAMDQFPLSTRFQQDSRQPHVPQASNVDVLQHNKYAACIHHNTSGRRW